MNVGLDLGYYDVKGVSGDRRFKFPSLVGTPDIARFSMNGQDKLILINHQGETYLVGDGAVDQSRFAPRREDRNWIESRNYNLLTQAALTELSPASLIDLTVVTGLPVSFYDTDAEKLKAHLLREHRVSRTGRGTQVFRVSQCKVVMQGIGIVLSLALDNQGRIADKDIATGNVGGIDVGSKTTNFITVSRLREVRTQTTSAEIGTWDLARQVREYINTTYPGLSLKDHQVLDIIKTRKIKYYGEVISLDSVIDQVLAPMTDEIISRAGQLWNGAAGLDRVIIGGGGAHLLGKQIENHFHHAHVIENPVYANAIGYWKYAQYLSRSDG